MVHCCFNHLILSHSDKNLFERAAILLEPDFIHRPTDYNHGFFTVFEPPPPALVAQGPEPDEKEFDLNLKLYGVNSLSAWCKMSWGTEWCRYYDGEAFDVHDTVVERDYPRIIARFFTGGTPPIPFYETLTRMGFTIDAFWHGGMQGIAGSYSSAAGVTAPLPPIYHEVLAGYDNGTGTPPRNELAVVGTALDGFVIRCTHCWETIVPGEPLFCRSVYTTPKLIFNAIELVLHLRCVSPELAGRVTRQVGDATEVRGFGRLNGEQRAAALRVFGGDLSAEDCCICLEPALKRTRCCSQALHAACFARHDGQRGARCPLCRAQDYAVV